MQHVNEETTKLTPLAIWLALHWTDKPIEIYVGEAWNTCVRFDDSETDWNAMVEFMVNAGATRIRIGDCWVDVEFPTDWHLEFTNRVGERIQEARKVWDPKTEQPSIRFLDLALVTEREIRRWKGRMVPGYLFPPPEYRMPE